MRKFRYLVIAVLIGLPAAVQAQTMSFQEAATILQRSCGADIEKHCRAVNFGSGRLRGCLEQNGAVSANCKADIARVFDGVQKRAQARVAVLKICDPDARRLCGLVQKGDGQILECMILAQRSVSPKCNQAITDAGYR